MVGTSIIHVTRCSAGVEQMVMTSGTSKGECAPESQERGEGQEEQPESRAARDVGSGEHG